MGSLDCIELPLPADCMQAETGKDAELEFLLEEWHDSGDGANPTARYNVAHVDRAVGRYG